MKSKKRQLLRSSNSRVRPVTGKAAKLAVGTQPSTTVHAVSISPAVTVAVKDGFGSTVTGSTANVNASLNVVSGSGTLSGTTSVNAVTGVATFSTLKVSSAGTYTLTFSSGGLPPVTSNQFTVT